MRSAQILMAQHKQNMIKLFHKSSSILDILRFFIWLIRYGYVKYNELSLKVFDLKHAIYK